MTVSTTLTPFPTPIPNRNTQTPSEFASSADSFVGHINTNVSEVNTWSTEVNSTASDVNSDASDAATSASTATAAAATATAASGATIYSNLVTYAAGDIVLDPNNFYISYTSQTGSNTGNTPSSDNGTNWRRTVTSQFTQIADASLGTGTHTFNYQTGDIQQLTATGNITLAVSNFPSGSPSGFIVDAVNWGSHTITHPAAWLFAGGTAPTYTSVGTDRLLIFKDKDNVYTLSVITQDIKTV